MIGQPRKLTPEELDEIKQLAIDAQILTKRHELRMLELQKACNVPSIAKLDATGAWIDPITGNSF